MIAYFDLHVGAITAITTILLTILTGIYVLLTHLLVKGMQKSREPFVAIDMELPDLRLRFIVSNMGQSPARNIRFVIAHDLTWLDIGGKKYGIGSIPAIKNGISTLAPGKSLKFHGGVLHNIPKTETVLSLEIYFEDEAGNSFSRKEIVDVAQFSDVLFESFKGESQGIEEAIKSLDHTLGAKLNKEPFLILTTKECPMCAERIPQKAKKCSHCGEMLETKDSKPTREDNIK